jgi:hypothetical protein
MKHCCMAKERGSHPRLAQAMQSVRSMRAPPAERRRWSTGEGGGVGGEAARCRNGAPLRFGRRRLERRGGGTRMVDVVGSEDGKVGQTNVAPPSRAAATISTQGWGRACVLCPRKWNAASAPVTAPRHLRPNSHRPPKHTCVWSGSRAPPSHRVQIEMGLRSAQL